MTGVQKIYQICLHYSKFLLTLYFNYILWLLNSHRMALLKEAGLKELLRERIYCELEGEKELFGGATARSRLCFDFISSVLVHEKTEGITLFFTMCLVFINVKIITGF